MITSLQIGRRVRQVIALAGAVTTLAGCGRDVPPATVEGTLRFHGQTLNQCLVTFLPEAGSEAEGAIPLA